MAKKQGLMTDEEFQTLLEGVQKIEQETAKMAEGQDLSSPAVEGEIPKELPEITVSVSTQPGAQMEKEEARSVKRKLVLMDDRKVEERKSKRMSKRCSERKMKKKGDILGFYMVLEGGFG